MNYAQEFLDWAKDKRFKIERLKTHFTPYEQAQRYIDETIWEVAIEGGVIIDAVQISDNDILIGVKSYWEDVDKNTHEYYLQFGECIYYYKLSEISLIDITDTDNYDDWEKRWTIDKEEDNEWRMEDEDND